MVTPSDDIIGHLDQSITFFMYSVTLFSLRNLSDSIL